MDDDLPRDEFVMAIDMPEGVDPRDGVRASQKRRGSCCQAAAIQMRKGPAERLSGDFHAHHFERSPYADFPLVAGSKSKSLIDALR